MGGDGGAGGDEACKTCTEGGTEGEGGWGVKRRRPAQARDPVDDVVPDGTPRAVVAGVVVGGEDGGRVARRGWRGRGR